MVETVCGCAAATAMTRLELAAEIALHAENRAEYERDREHHDDDRLDHRPDGGGIRCTHLRLLARIDRVGGDVVAIPPTAAERLE